MMAPYFNNLPASLCLVAVALLLGGRNQIGRIGVPANGRPKIWVKILGLLCVGLGCLWQWRDLLILLLAGGAIGATWWWLHRRSQQRRAYLANCGHLRETLRILRGELSAGAEISQALLNAAQATPGPLQQLLLSAARQPAQGPKFLVTQAESIPELALLGSLWRSVQESGAAASTVLGPLESCLAAKLRHCHKTLASLQGPRLSAQLLSILPLAGLGLGHVMGANPTAVLIHNGLGQICLVLGVSLNCAGLVLSELLLARAAGWKVQ